MLSALITVPCTRSARASASPDLPLAVGPAIRMARGWSIGLLGRRRTRIKPHGSGWSGGSGSDTVARPPRRIGGTRGAPFPRRIRLLASPPLLDPPLLDPPLLDPPLLDPPAQSMGTQMADDIA